MATGPPVLGVDRLEHGPPHEAPEHEAATPHSETAYDEDLRGLAATWWSNVHLANAPRLHRHGIGTNGAVNRDWGGGAPSGLGTNNYFSGRLTGWIETPVTKAWDFRFVRDGKVRLYIDEHLVIDEWTASTVNAEADPINLTAGLHRIVVEYADTTGDASVQLKWHNQGSWEVVPASALTPGYGNPTTEIAPTGRMTTRNFGAPHLHQAGLATADPSGLALTVDFEFEGPTTDEFRRLVSQTEPNGETTTTTFYDSNWPLRDNPCTPESDAVHQGGLTRKTTAPDPDGAGPGEAIANEVIYDVSGRLAAQRTGDEDWVCFTYDSRSRPTSTSWPEFGDEDARTVTYDHAVDDNPLVTSVSDNETGTITTYRDLLGRTVATEDVWGNTTTVTYDLAGRPTSSTGEGGTLSNTLDGLGRLDTVALDGQVLADVTYDNLSRIESVDYPSGTNEAGNGTRLHDVSYDDLGRTTGITWHTAAGTVLASHGRTLDVGGRVIDETIDGTDPHPAGPNFGYDAVGRLIEAHVPGHDLQYAFASSGGCGLSADAGRTTNRTSMVDNGVTTTYCYDRADRLTETTAAGIGTDIAYDDHGNVVELGDATMGYDAGNQHLTTTTAQSTVRYTRDATGAIVAREATGEPTLRYSSGPAGVSLVTDTQNQILERIVGLPGGASVTLGATERWSYPNLAGSVVATADASGAKVGPTRSYDPYGNALNGIPDTHEGNYDVGWLGGVGTEHAAGAPTLVEMGARLYSPLLGRFLEVDPVRGGSANAYDYANGDPVNSSDRSGEEPWCHLYGCSDYHQNMQACGYGGYTADECRVYVSPSNPDAWYTAAKADTGNWAAAYAYAAAIEAEKWREYGSYLRGLWKKSLRVPVVHKVASSTPPWEVVSDAIGDCISDPLGCADNIQIALSPIVAAGATVLVGWGLVAACATIIGCIVAAPLLGSAFVAGIIATWKLTEEIYFDDEFA